MGKTYSDEMIVAAIMSTKTNSAAIKALGINERYFYTRLKEKPLQAKLEAARAEMTKEVGNQLKRSLTAAVDVLIEIMSDRDANKQTRVYAANSIIQNCLKVTEREAVVARLEAIENEL